MKQQYVKKRFTQKNRELLSYIQILVKQYQDRGYRLTLRQLYYRLVSDKVFENETRYYKSLSELLTNARLAGLVDWDIIVDRIRRPYIKSEFDGAKHLIESAIRSFRLPRHCDQDYYVELWTEKDALAEVLEPIANQYHVPLVINRGYSSASAMYRASHRFISAEHTESKINHYQSPVIIYLGDHDPSGLDMDRDISARLKQFWADVEFRRIALTMDQIDDHSLAPDPAKVNDSRFKKYAQKYGRKSWEVDSLDPPTLDAIVREALEEYIDMDVYNKWIPRENKIKEELENIAHDLGNFDFTTVEKEYEEREE